MYHFTADARDGIDASSCDTCCCEHAKARQGETNLWQINYAPWSAPIGGKGLSCATTMAIEKIVSCDENAPVEDPLYVSVPDDRVEVSGKGHYIRFPVIVDEAAKPSEVYRLTVTQTALSCDCDVFKHVSCYDIVIGKC